MFNLLAFKVVALYKISLTLYRNPCPRPLVVSSVHSCALQLIVYYNMQPTTKHNSCSPVIRHPGFNSQWLLAFNYFTSYNDTYTVYVTQQTKKKWQQHDFKSVKTWKLSLLHQAKSKFLYGRMSNRILQCPKASL